MAFEMVDMVLGMGYTGVACHQLNWREVGTYDDEITEFEFVGFKSGQYWYLQISVIEKFGPRSGGMEKTVVDRKNISPAEYNSLLAQFGGVQDTPEYHRKKQEEEFERRHQQKVAAANQQAFEQLRPTCSCGAKMKLRTRRRDGHPFWGCPRWPNCDHTENLTSATKHKLAEIGYL